MKRLNEMDFISYFTWLHKYLHLKGNKKFFFAAIAVGIVIKMKRTYVKSHCCFLVFKSKEIKYGIFTNWERADGLGSGNKWSLENLLKDNPCVSLIYLRFFRKLFEFLTDKDKKRKEIKMLRGNLSFFLISHLALSYVKVSVWENSLKLDLNPGI